MTWRPSLVFTDALLFDSELSPPAKLVLAATLGYPNRNPSLSQLAAYLPLSRTTVADAQDELEAAGAVRYDRPAHAWERQASNPRFRRSTRLAGVTARFDPHAEENRRKVIELPAAIVAELPRGRKNASLHPMLAAVYTREQLRRRAVQIEDDVAAWRLGISPRQVRRAREEFVGTVLEFDRRESPCNVYVMPGATVTPPEPLALDADRTRRLLPLTLNGACTLTVYANEAELGEAARRIARLADPMLVTWAWLKAFPSVLDADDTRPTEVGPLLDSLARTIADPPPGGRFDRDTREIVPFATQSPEVDRSKHLCRSFKARDLDPLPREDQNLDAAAPRDGLTTEGESVLTARSDTRRSVGRGEERLSDDEEGDSASLELPGVTRRLVELFGDRARLPHTWAAWAVRVLDERCGLYNTERRQIAEAALLDQIERAATEACTDRRALHALVRRGLAWAATDDALYERIRRAPVEPDAPATEGTVEVNIAELLAGAADR